MRRIVVTPSQARQWLEGNNNHNRRLSKHAVNRYATDMKAGRWRNATSEVLAFDTHGNLQDGQHRLAALIEADVAVEFWVLLNAHPEDYKVLDQGKTRTAGDALSVNGIAQANTVSAIAKMILSLKHRSNQVWSNYTSATKVEVTDFTLAHLDAITWATNLSGRVRSGARLPQAQFGAVAFVAADGAEGIEQIEQFTDLCARGEMLADDSPAFTLRKWAIKRAGLVDSYAQQRAVAIITKAWNAFVEDRPLSVCYWRRDELPMPTVLKSTY